MARRSGVAPDAAGLFAVVIAVLLVVIAFGQQGVEVFPERGGTLTSMEVVSALRAAGLEAEDPRPMAPNEFGVAPVLTDDATRFTIPSLTQPFGGGPDGSGSGGRAFVLDSVEDLRRMKAVYDELGRNSGMLFSWTFANEEQMVLVQLNGTLPQEQAAQYGAVVASL